MAGRGGGRPCRGWWARRCPPIRQIRQEGRRQEGKNSSVVASTADATFPTATSPPPFVLTSCQLAGFARRSTHPSVSPS
uniref:Uncharacterized protein n=1 Tax=Oryza sativa subsp. japonica TaxID=39947 RepID=Q5Z6E4_ORYSJ|nr:hypothetical protein [Oryza sativa Japonica Group]